MHSIVTTLREAVIKVEVANFGAAIDTLIDQDVGLHVCGLVVGSKTLIQGSWILEENKIGQYVVVYCLPICSCANFILFLYIYIFINLTDKKKYHTSVSQIYGWIGVDCSGFPIN